jgi:undecaprenyl-diphosphatase
LIGLDRRLDRWVVGHRIGWLDWLPEWLSRIGTLGAVWLMIALVVAVWWRRPAVWGSTLVAAATADLSTFALKKVIPRDRPHVHALVTRPHDHSFPSGHAATSFACATVIGATVPRLRVPLFVLAAAIAASRVYVGVHYPLDVIGGSLYGVALGLLLVKALPPLSAALLRSLRARRRG